MKQVVEKAKKGPAEKKVVKGDGKVGVMEEMYRKVALALEGLKKGDK